MELVILVDSSILPSSLHIVFVPVVSVPVPALLLSLRCSQFFRHLQFPFEYLDLLFILWNLFKRWSCL